MKKKAVQQDPLAEKIEEILTPYPDPMCRNEFRKACHIGTRTTIYLLQTGLVPCKNNGRPPRVRSDALYSSQRMVLQLPKTQKASDLIGSPAQL